MQLVMSVHRLSLCVSLSDSVSVSVSDRGGDYLVVLLLLI